MPQPRRAMGEENIKVFKLTVIRHGETYANKEKILQGQMDYCLSDVGQQQAIRLGARMGAISLTAVYTSDLSRAYQTADIMVKEAKVGVKPLRESLIRERCFGVFEGRASSHLRAAAKEAGLDMVDYSPEGGETLKQCQYRANMFCDHLCQSVGGNTAEKKTKSEGHSCSFHGDKSFGPLSPVESTESSTLSTRVGGQPTVSTRVSGQPTVSTRVGGQPTVSTRVGGQPSVSTRVGGQPSVSTRVGGQPSVSNGFDSTTSLILPPSSDSTSSTSMDVPFNNRLEVTSSGSGNVRGDSYSMTNISKEEIPHIAVVTHGGFMRCLFRHFYDKHACRNLPSKSYKTTPPNTSLNSFLVTIHWCPEKKDPFQSESDKESGEWKVLGMECLALHDVQHVA